MRGGGGGQDDSCLPIEPFSPAWHRTQGITYSNSVSLSYCVLKKTLSIAPRSNSSKVHNSSGVQLELKPRSVIRQSWSQQVKAESIYMPGSVSNKPETLLVVKPKANERSVIAEKTIRPLLIHLPTMWYCVDCALEAILPTPRPSSRGIKKPICVMYLG